MSKRKGSESGNRRKRDGNDPGMTLDPENGLKQENRTVPVQQCTIDDKGERKLKNPEKEVAPVATRTSARVLNRQTLKRDGSPPGSSVRVINNKPASKREASPPGSPQPCNKKQARTLKVHTPETTKSRRNWEGWSSEDKNTFFEGLYEYGKDFESIQSLIVKKCKKRGVLAPLFKDRDQVRHLYYRTWHKISKHIKQRSDVSKTTNELFGLINYGEFRKRVGTAVNEKTGPKLNELVHTGKTCFINKGKRAHIRTPMCRALKNLANHEELSDPDIRKPRVPEHITLELQPKNNGAWTHIQAMAQNPCVRIKMRSDKTLASVISYLSRKWKPRRLRIKEHLKAPEEFNDKELSLSLPSNLELVPISLEELKPTLTRPKGEITLSNIPPGFKDCEALGDDKNHTGDDDPQTQSEESCHSSDDIHDQSGEKSQDVNHMDTESSHSEVTNSISTKKRGAFSSIFDGELMTDAELVTVGNQMLTGEGLDDVKDVETSKSNNENVECSKISSDCKDNDEKKESMQESTSNAVFENLKQGCTAAEASKISLAQLWLAVSNTDKIILFYEWIDSSNKIDFMQQNLANMLRRLIHLATTEFTDFSRQSTLQTTPTKCAKCGCDNSPGDTKGTPPNSKKASSRTSCGTSPRSGVTCKSQGTQTVNIFSVSRRPPVGRVLGSSFNDQNVQPQQLVKQNGVVNVSGSQEKVFRMPAIPIKTHTIRKDPAVNGVPKPVPSINMPKKPRKSVQYRKPLIVQRTILPKAENVLSKQLAGVPVIANNVRNGAVVVPPGVNPALFTGTATSVGQVKTLPTSCMSPASTGAIAVRHIVPGVSPTPDADSGGIDTKSQTATSTNSQTVTKGTEGELLSQKMTTSDVLPTDDVSKLFTPDPQVVLSADISPSKILQAAVSQAGIADLINIKPDDSTGEEVVSQVRTSSPVSSETVEPGAPQPVTSNSSPPNVTSLLDISLPGFDTVENPEMEIAYDGNSVSSFSAFFDQEEQKFEDGHVSKEPPSLSLHSDPFDEISLSSLITTQVPKTDKKTTVSNTAAPSFEFADNSLPAQVDLHSLMNEASQDYVAKFAELVDKLEPQK